MESLKLWLRDLRYVHLGLLGGNPYPATTTSSDSEVLPGKGDEVSGDRVHESKKLSPQT